MWVNDPFTPVHYLRYLTVNGVTARRNSGNTACSLRSLRSTALVPRRAKSLCSSTSTLLERSERSVQTPLTCLQSLDFAVHCRNVDIVNGGVRP